MFNVHSANSAGVSLLESGKYSGHHWSTGKMGRAGGVERRGGAVKWGGRGKGISKRTLFGIRGKLTNFLSRFIVWNESLSRFPGFILIGNHWFPCISRFPRAIVILFIPSALINSATTQFYYFKPRPTLFLTIQPQAVNYYLFCGVQSEYEYPLN